MPFRLVPPSWGLRLWITVRALQHALYRAAKADPGRRFHTLRDKVYRRDVLWRGWVAVRRNDGAPGIDKITLDQIEKEYGIDRLLGELADELREGTYRPLPMRRVWIGISPVPASSVRVVDSCGSGPGCASGAARLCSSRSLKPILPRAVLGFARNGVRMTPCRYSLMSPGRGGGGWSKPISHNVFRRYRMKS